MNLGSFERRYLEYFIEIYIFSGFSFLQPLSIKVIFVLNHDIGLSIIPLKV